MKEISANENKLFPIKFRWENLLQKLCVCFNLSTKSRLCIVQQFFSSTKDSKKGVNMLRMIPGVEGLPQVELKKLSSL